MAKKQALYHRTGHKSKPLFIIGKANEDGTVNLGDENDKVVVSNCPVTKHPKNGCCTKGTTTPPPEKTGEDAAETEKTGEDAAETEKTGEAAADTQEKGKSEAKPPATK